MAAAAGLSPEHEAVLLDIVNRPLPEADDPTFVDVITADNYTFHLTIAQASGNPRLVRAVDEVLLEGERLYRLVIAGLQPSHDHRRITEALLSGQADRAATLTHEHIEVVRTRIMETYLSSQAVLESELVFPRL
jgi:DNA-binding GntR family transcriptional regulator